MVRGELGRSDPPPAALRERQSGCSSCGARKIVFHMFSVSTRAEPKAEALSHGGPSPAPPRPSASRTPKGHGEHRPIGGDSVGMVVLPAFSDSQCEIIHLRSACWVFSDVDVLRPTHRALLLVNTRARDKSSAAHNCNG